MAIALALLGVALAVYHPGAARSVVYTVASLPAGPGYLSVAPETQRLFISSGNARGGSRLLVVNTRTGVIIHSAYVPYHITSLTADRSSGHVFVASFEQPRVQMLDARSGKLDQVINTPSTTADLAVDQQAGRLYVAGSGFRRCLAPQGRCDSGDRAGGVSVFDSRNGRLIHTLGFPGSAWMRLAVDSRRQRLIVVNPHLVAPARAPTNMVNAVGTFSTRTWRLIRRYPLTNIVEQAPIVDESAGRAFISVGPSALDGGAIANLTVLDTHSGMLIYSLPLGRAPGSGVVDGRTGRLFAAVNDLLNPDGGGVVHGADPGGLQVFDGQRAILQDTLMGNDRTTAVALLPARHLLLVATDGSIDALGNYRGPGAVSVVDDRSGAILRTIAVGVAPALLALDPGSDHLFVYNAGGSTYTQRQGSWRWLPAWATRWLRIRPDPPQRVQITPASVTSIDLRGL